MESVSAGRGASRLLQRVGIGGVRLLPRTGFQDTGDGGIGCCTGMGFLSNGNGVITITFSDAVSLSTNHGNKNYYIYYFVIGIKPSDKKADAFGAPMPCGAGSSVKPRPATIMG